jgi:hypothetical protein
MIRSTSSSTPCAHDLIQLVSYLVARSIRYLRDRLIESGQETVTLFVATRFALRPGGAGDLHRSRSSSSVLLSRFGSAKPVTHLTDPLVGYFAAYASVTSRLSRSLRACRPRTTIS